MLTESYKIDNKTFVIPRTDVYVEVYQAKYLRPFEDARKIKALLNEASKKAEGIGFRTDEMQISGPSTNMHWGLLPAVGYKFSGDMHMSSTKQTKIEGLDEERKPKVYSVSDSWCIRAGSTGEITSNYGRWGKDLLPMVYSEKRRDAAREIAKMVPLDKII
jgi:hypothetical protein